MNTPLPEKKVYSLSSAEIFSLFNTREEGLNSQEVEERLRLHGNNDLPREKKTSFFVLLGRQFESPLIYILLVASIIVFILSEYVDALVILSVLLINAIIGLVQEGRAENTLEALKKFVETSAHVIRQGVEVVVPDSNLVPGDIIVLKEGDKVSADARIIASSSCKVNESALTGESEPVLKISNPIHGTDVPVSDQKNMFFRGTFIVSGHALALVTGTGTKTVIGAISQKLSSFDTEMPLKADIKLLSRFISIVVIIASTILFIIGLLYGNSFKEMFFTAVAVSVSVVPEGLPIVITLVLAAGVFRMAKQNALVKRLQAVEALGQADVIAVDKTGTITKNELMVEKIFVKGSLYDVTGDGYGYEGSVLSEGVSIDVANHEEILLMGRISAYCASARTFFSPEENLWKASGEPTEAALYVFGKKTGFDKDELEQEDHQLLDMPFDSKTKFHATVHSTRKGKFLTVVGAPEEVLRLSTSIWMGRSKKMSQKERDVIEVQIHELSSKGLRVLACAINTRASKIVSSEDVSALTFVGLFAMRDVLRQEVLQSVRDAEASGVKVVMITGDHKVTAEAIGRSAGIFKDGDKILTGKEIEILSDQELSLKISHVSVFARVAPEHKLRIVEAYRRAGNIVAMTGDGVNDALSLVAADLGVAMGKTGTEVTKEAADIILLDDNFKSIVSAIEEGRSIYATIRKVLVYLFSTGLGEFLTIACAILLMLPLPLLPTQILWLNLVTDGFLVVAFAVEPREILKRKQHGRALIDKTMLVRTILMGLVMTIGSLILFWELYETDVVRAGTVVLTVLAVFQWINVWNCRSEYASVFSSNPFKNRFLVVSTFIAILLHISILYTPFGQTIFRTVPLSLVEWSGIILVGFSILFVEEIRKLIYRRMHF
jgi:Ca2+-transporting ATPase